MSESDRAGQKRPAPTADESLPTCPRCDAPVTGIATPGPGAHEANPCGCRLGSARLEEIDREPRMLADGGQIDPEEAAPDILDVVDAPDGTTCQMWGSPPDDPERCEAEAEYLVVFDSLVNPNRTKRKNVLACSNCFTPREKETREVATDGGR